MSLIFRKVNNSNNWNKDNFTWLPDGDSSPVHTKSLSIENRTRESHAISLYKLLDDDKLEESINRVVIALAVNRDQIANFDFILFDDEILLKGDFTLDESILANTADAEVNKWHLDLTNFTTHTMVRFIDMVYPRPDRYFRRIRKNGIYPLIHEGIKYERLDLNTFSEKVKEQYLIWKNKNNLS